MHSEKYLSSLRSPVLIGNTGLVSRYLLDRVASMQFAAKLLHNWSKRSIIITIAATKAVM